MATTPNPDPVQQQIDELKAEIEKLQAEKAARTGAPVLLQPLVKWVQSKGGWTHAAVIVYLGAVTLIAGVPQVHTLFLEAWGHSPKWLVDTVSAIGPVIAFYKSPAKSQEEA